MGGEGDGMPERRGVWLMWRYDWGSSKVGAGRRLVIIIATGMQWMVDDPLGGVSRVRYSPVSCGAIGSARQLRNRQKRNRRTLGRWRGREGCTVSLSRNVKLC